MRIPRLLHFALIGVLLTSCGGSQKAGGECPPSENRRTVPAGIAQYEDDGVSITFAVKGEEDVVRGPLVVFGMPTFLTPFAAIDVGEALPPQGDEAKWAIQTIEDSEFWKDEGEWLFEAEEWGAVAIPNRTGTDYTARLSLSDANPEIVSRVRVWWVLEYGDCVAVSASSPNSAHY